MRPTWLPIATNMTMKKEAGRKMVTSTSNSSAMVRISSSHRAHLEVEDEEMMSRTRDIAPPASSRSIIWRIQQGLHKFRWFFST